MKKVGIVMGSDSDLPILQKAMDTLTDLNVPYECHIYSAHRTPDEAAAFARNAKKNGIGVIIMDYLSHPNEQGNESSSQASEKESAFPTP